MSSFWWMAEQFLMNTVSTFLTMKILMQDLRRLRLKEAVFIFVAGGVMLGFQQVWNISGLSRPIVLAMILFIYAYWMKFYSLKKSFVFAMTATFFYPISVGSAMFVASLFPWTLSQYLTVPLMIVPAMCLYFLVKYTRNLRKIVSGSEHAQTLLIIIWIFLFVLLGVGATETVSIMYADDEYGFYQMLAVIFSFFAVFASIIFIVLLRTLTMRMEAEHIVLRKEAEQKALETYTVELEKHHTSMRKFKHDYQNILTSMHSFIKDKDLDGLEQYYTLKIAPASEVITKNDLALDSLGQIKVLEIKSILVAKFMLAHSNGISPKFEADEEIDYIPVDSIALVRMLGIILDNAIEALMELGHGELQIACIKDELDILFIVQNTCHPDMPDLQQLESQGFSTKGEGRGLGLVNLAELTASQPNIMLETSVKDQRFTQVLRIGGEI